MIFNSQDHLFRWIWKHRPHRSEITGRCLGDYSTWYFAHNLAKGPYPRFALRPINIVLMTPREHFMFDQETHLAKLDKRFDWVFLQRQLLKSQYYHETAN